MKVSVCMATHNRPAILNRVLSSIFCQLVPFDYEVIIVDDGPIDFDTCDICERYPVQYIRNEREPGWRNPSKARNMAYKKARGEIIICQSDDVEHSGNAIEGLASSINPGYFSIAMVINIDPVTRKVDSEPLPFFTGPHNHRPFFFLGAIYREDLYAIGGNDEEFVSPGYDDDWFADCLMHGRGLKPQYLDNVTGYHLKHDRHFQSSMEFVEPSMRLYHDKVRKGVFIASGGSWLPVIEKHMNFFWSRSPLPWLRYQTLRTFRHWNPDWKMTLALCDSVEAINGPEPEYKQNQVASDCLPLVESLDIKIKEWSPPIPVKYASQASDLFCWETLANESGYYSDMDIIYTGPMSEIERCVRNADTVLMSSNGYLTVGFLGSHHSSLFADVYNLAKKSLNDNVDEPQSGGCLSLYRLAENYKFWCYPGQNLKAIKSLIVKYPRQHFETPEDWMIYPWDFRDSVKWFCGRETAPPKRIGIGIHWFGGLPSCQRQIKELTEENYREHNYFLLNYLP